MQCKCGCPKGLFGSLALGTMAISTAVVTVVYHTAILTNLLMTTQRGCAALEDVVQNLDLFGG